MTNDERLLKIVLRYKEELQNGQEAWKHLKKETGIDLKKLFEKLKE